MSARDLQTRMHPTCIEVTPRPGVPREWLCGPQCPPSVPVPIAPDAARDARVAKRRAADARKAGAALDRLLSAVDMTLQAWQLERLRAAYAEYLKEHSASEVHHNGHYGVPPADNLPVDMAAAAAQKPAVHFASSACRRTGKSSADWSDVTCEHCLSLNNTIKPNYGVPGSRQDPRMHVAGCQGAFGLPCVPECGPE